MIFCDDDVIQIKIMAILSTNAVRFPMFSIEIYTKKKQLLILNALTYSHETWSRDTVW